MSSLFSYHSCWRAWLLAGVVAMPVTVLAQSLQPGQVASPAVLEAARQQQGVDVGDGRVLRVVPGAGLPAQRSSAAGSTAGLSLVLSDPGGQVGISHHEISVVGAETAQVDALARQMNPRATVNTFPDLRLTLVRVPAFADIAPMLAHLRRSLPDAGIEVPVTWNLAKPR